MCSSWQFDQSCGKKHVFAKLSIAECCITKRVLVRGERFIRGKSDLRRVQQAAKRHPEQKGLKAATEPVIWLVSQIQKDAIKRWGWVLFQLLQMKTLKRSWVYWVLLMRKSQPLMLSKWLPRMFPGKEQQTGLLHISGEVHISKLQLLCIESPTSPWDIELSPRSNAQPIWGKLPVSAVYSVSKYM